MTWGTGLVIALYLSRGGLIAGLYFVLTVAPGLNAISYGPLQFRVSEVLTVLAYFEPAAIPGLWLGAAAANFYGPFGLIDVVFGSSLTLIAAWLTWRIRNPYFALIPPVLINGIGVAVMLKYLVAVPVPEALFFLIATVSVGEIIVIYGLGLPLLLLILNSRILIRPGVGKEV